MKLLAATAIAAFALLGCTDSPRSQEQVRRETAEATKTVVSDVKGAALGIRDGLHDELHKPASTLVDINTAPRPTLETLPGITPALASSIVAHRPYSAPDDLHRRHILTRAQLDAISASITVNN